MPEITCPAFKPPKRRAGESDAHHDKRVQYLAARHRDRELMAEHHRTHNTEEMFIGAPHRYRINAAPDPAPGVETVAEIEARIRRRDPAAMIEIVQL